MSNSNAIEVTNLTKRFGSFTSVDNISFNVKQGEIFGFLGANGAGKSTTIKMLCGILQPTSGEALVAGSSITNSPDNVKLKIGYMSQRFSLYDDLTVEENINFFGGVYGLKNSLLKERKKWAIKMAELEGKEKTLTGSLPGGIKQRLALGTAVIHKPGIVFLDEPTSGVDPLSRRSFWELIHEMSAEGTTVFVTTHYLEEAEFCNNIILLDAGKIVAEGNPVSLKTNYIKDKILEIESDDSVKAMDILSAAEFVNETSIFGTKIHISVNNKLNSFDEINNILSTNNINVVSVQQITPTLEDVFIHLLERRYNA